jgi:hypothetical protein
LDHDLGEILGFAILFIGFGLQPALDVDPVSLFQMLLDNSGKPFPSLEIEPLGIFNAVTILVPEGAVGRQ